MGGFVQVRLSASVIIWKRTIGYTGELTVKITLVTAVLATIIVVGCSTNPVTGKREVSLVGEAWELDVGKKQYSPLRQMQGGDYVADKNLQAYVNQVGQRLAAVSDRKLPYEFKVINDSTPNAWALPGGKISINRGLLTELKNEAELAAVLGHEVVHAAARHGAQGVTRGAGLQAGMLAVLIGTSGRVDPNVAQLGAGIGAQLINSKYGRDAERESDRFGMKYMARAGYDPQGAVGLQETFVELSKGRNQNKFAQMFASHPASIERVINNRKMVASLKAEFPNATQLRTSEFRRAMARINKTKPAYENYTKAIKAVKDGNKAEARSLVEKAIRIEPREGHFHSLLGDLSRDVKQYEVAKRHYDKAIALNSEFFYYYLGRGIALEKAGRSLAAKSDLNRSMKLLPTATAQEALGNIARAARDFTTAKKHYQAAAGAGGATGDSAMSSLIELDLEQNPGAYLKAAVAGLRNGAVVLKVQNGTPKSVRGVTLEIVNTATGQRTTRSVNGVLKPKTVNDVPTNIRMSAAQAKALKVTVVRASLAR